MIDRSGLRCGLVTGVTALVAVFGATSVTARATSLPDGRGFELVSAPPANDTPAVQTFSSETQPLSDDTVVYGGGPTSSGPSSSGENPVYLATRGATGWSVSSIVPSEIPADVAYTLYAATPSLSAAVFQVATPALGGLAPSANVPATSLVYRDAAGNFETVAQGSSTVQPTVAGLSADGNTVVFSSSLTPAGAPQPNGQDVVYAWHSSGAVTQLDGSAGDALHGCSAQVANGTNQVSSDASTVFVESLPNGAPGCPANSQLYVNVGGHDRQISVSSDGSDTDPSDVRFIGAAPDGSSAFFTASSALTPDANDQTQLYEWRASTGTISCASCEATAASTSQGTSISQSAVAPDGTTAYFGATNPSPASDNSNFFELFATTGTVQTLLGSNASGYNVNSAGFATTPDGSTVVYQDGANLALYKVSLTGSTASAPQCVSCAPDGTPEQGQIGLYTQPTIILPAGDVPAGAISADGTTVVYMTPTALGAANQGPQVEEWTAATGSRFIADGYLGTGGNAAITPDGEDLFFASVDKLTFDAPTGGVISLYDARVGGGFPAPAVTTPCSGDGCQGPSPAGQSGAVTSTSGCCGNVSAGPRPSVRFKTLSRVVLARAARTGRIPIRISARGGGLLRLTAWTTAGRRRRQVASVRRRLTGDGDRTITVLVKLSAQARHLLVAERRLTLTVTVALPAAASQSRRLTLVVPANGDRS